MKASSRTAKELMWFFAGTFIPTIGLGIYAARSGNPNALVAMTPLAMLTPALSAFAVQKLVVRAPIFRGSSFALRWGKLRWWILGPTAFALFVFAAVFGSFLLTPSLQVTPNQFVANVAHLRGLPLSGLPSMTAFALAIAASMLIGPVLNIPIFLGEELGWRGFMNPRLIDLYGRAGLLIGGVIWAAWHLPIILLGHNYPDHPFLGFLVWIPICICMNILLQGIKERAGSIFPSALAHGVMNQLAGVMMAVLFAENLFVDFLHGPAGLIGLGVLIVPAAIVFSRWPVSSGAEAVFLPVRRKARKSDLRYAINSQPSVAVFPKILPPSPECKVLRPKGVLESVRKH